MIETHECPGGCGRQLPTCVVACRTCFGQLPASLREAYNTAGIYHDHDGLAQAEALALRWYADRERANNAIPVGTRKNENGTTYQWEGRAWRLVPRSELDAEAWAKSRGQA
jgi:hypothetical protein